jgi:hypothetical protein
MSWAHAVSPDLVCWEELPVALEPDELGQIFSGGAVVGHHGTSGFSGGQPGLVAIYTSAGESQQQSIAYSTDRGRTWTKHADNPVIPNPGIADFRDPKVFWHEGAGRWVLLVAVGDRIQIHGSANLRDWELLSEFGTDHGSHGGVWSAPTCSNCPWTAIPPAPGGSSSSASTRAGPQVDRRPSTSPAISTAPGSPRTARPRRFAGPTGCGLLRPAVVLRRARRPPVVVGLDQQLELRRQDPHRPVAGNDEHAAPAEPRHRCRRRGDARAAARRGTRGRAPTRGCGAAR